MIVFVLVSAPCVAFAQRPKSSVTEEAKAPMKMRMREKETEEAVVCFSSRLLN